MTIRRVLAAMGYSEKQIDELAVVGQQIIVSMQLCEDGSTHYMISKVKTEQSETVKKLTRKKS